MNNQFENIIKLFCDRIPPNIISPKILEETGIKDLNDDELLQLFKYIQQKLEQTEQEYLNGQLSVDDDNYRDKLEVLEGTINSQFEFRENGYKWAEDCNIENPQEQQDQIHKVLEKYYPMFLEKQPDDPRMVYICRLCNNYCDTEICYVCDEESAKLTIMEGTKEEDLEIIKSELDSLERSELDVFLSQFGDSPGGITIVSMKKTELFAILEDHDFIVNDITSVHDKGALRKCIGIALLDEFLYKDEEIKGIMILTEY